MFPPWIMSLSWMNLRVGSWMNWFTPRYFMNQSACWFMNELIHVHEWINSRSRMTWSTVMNELIHVIHEWIDPRSWMYWFPSMLVQSIHSSWMNRFTSRHCHICMLVHEWIYSRSLMNWLPHSSIPVSALSHDVPNAAIFYAGIKYGLIQLQIRRRPDTAVDVHA